MNNKKAEKKGKITKQIPKTYKDRFFLSLSLALSAL